MGRRLAALAAVAAAAVLAPAAGAVELLRPDGTAWGGTWQRWVDEARAATPAGAVTFVPDWCPDAIPGVEARAVLGCTYPDRRLVYVRRDQPFRRRSLLHELGHVVEAEYATDAERAAWADVVGLAWPAAREVFAEAYADCAGPPRASWHTIRGACPWIRAIAARAVGS